MKINDIKKYMQHLTHCNRMQDWTEAYIALADCPDGPDKEQAYIEMKQKQSQCTCGLEEAIKFIESKMPVKKKKIEYVELACGNLHLKGENCNCHG